MQLNILPKASKASWLRVTRYGMRDTGYDFAGCIERAVRNFILEVSSVFFMAYADPNGY